MAGELEQGVADVVADLGFLEVSRGFGEPGLEAVVAVLLFLGGGRRLGGRRLSWHGQRRGYRLGHLGERGRAAQQG